MRQTVFNDITYALNPKLSQNNRIENLIKSNMKIIYSTIVFKYKSNLNRNKILTDIAPKIDESENTLLGNIRRTLSQLRKSKCSLLLTYKSKINLTSNPQSNL